MGPVPLDRYLNKISTEILIKSFGCVVIFLWILQFADLLKND
jgi:hypothetical protein